VKRAVRKGDVWAIVLAGGDGERLWPLSTPERPKQFVEIFGGKPLIAHAVDRLAGFVPPERTLVVTAERLVAMTRAALPRIPRANIYGEPCRKNTGPAVAVACGLVRRFGGPDAVGCVVTADQLMEPASAFRRTLRAAVRVARKTEAIVTIGVKPTYPATGFGYIHTGAVEDFGTADVVRGVLQFVEKPPLARAKRYVASGRYLWNAGMFIWRASVLGKAFAAAAPDLARVADEVVRAKGVPAVLKKIYPALRSVSVDYAVMEKTRAIRVVEAGFGWDDVGSWISLANHFPADADGNVRLGRTKVLDTAHSIVRSGDGHLVAVLGLKDVVVAHTPTATLVCAKSRAQDLRKLLAL